MRLLLLLIFLIPATLQAQFSYVVDQSIKVKDGDGNLLHMPWGGGLNAAQYNTIDLNHDNQDDLVLFDRMGNKVITYLYADGKYNYAPAYEKYFPAEITNWVLLRDYNCDGKKDLFTGDVLGIKVYQNISEDGGLPEWKQFFFWAGAGSTSLSPVLLSKGFSIKINLQLQYDDLPAIADMDGDGDLDILCMRFSGNSSAEYHQNFSKERYGTCDSLDFERITQHWGGFTECGCDEFAFNEEECPSSGGRIKHAGGKSLLTLDLNNDGDQDVIFSESSCTQLYELSNSGTVQAPVVSSSSTFPNTHPVNFQIFPSAFYEDIDHDGRKDLVSSPNIYGKDFLDTDLISSNWFYKNTGTNALPVFTYVQNNLLQEDMIDVGDNAVPAFGDVDGDGDFDMLISQNSSLEVTASVYFYRNTGTINEPEFEFVTDDYLGISNLSLFNLKLHLADVTGDNNVDLVFTATNFQNLITTLYYVANKSSGAFDFGGQSLQSTGFTVARGENVHITDINLDGVQDVLVGKANGALEYWKNTASAGSFNFVLEDPAYLNLEFTVLRQAPQCVTADMDADGKTDLVLSDQSGVLRILSNYREAENADGAFTDIIFNPLAAAYASQNMGGRSWPTVVNLFNTNKPAIVVGNILGGVQVLRNDNGESLPNEPVVIFYPNPLSAEEVLHIRIDRPGQMELYSMLGQRISDPVPLQPNQEYLYKIPYLARGVYIVKFTASNKSIAKRIVVR